MSTITLRLAPETEQKLRVRAEREGRTVESLLERLAEQSVNEEFEQEYFPTGEPKYITRPRLTAEEFMNNLRLLASGPPLPILPPDFSRADIYDDHD
jgi:hypothetical protein